MEINNAGFKNFAGTLEKYMNDLVDKRIDERLLNTDTYKRSDKMFNTSFVTLKPVLTGTYSMARHAFVSSDTSVRQGYTENNGRVVGVALFRLPDVHPADCDISLSFGMTRLAGYGKFNPVISYIQMEAFDKFASIDLKKTCENTFKDTRYFFGEMSGGESKYLDRPCKICSDEIGNGWAVVTITVDDNCAIEGKLYSQNYAKFDNCELVLKYS